jgi:hypothetical protein
MIPANASGTATSTLPAWQVIWFSAKTASTSGGMGGVQALTSPEPASADTTRTMPRMTCRGIVLHRFLALVVRSERNCFVLPT